MRDKGPFKKNKQTTKHKPTNWQHEISNLNKTIQVEYKLVFLLMLNMVLNCNIPATLSIWYYYKEKAEYSFPPEVLYL